MRRKESSFDAYLHDSTRSEVIMIQESQKHLRDIKLIKVTFTTDIYLTFEGAILMWARITDEVASCSRRNGLSR